MSKKIPEMDPPSEYYANPGWDVDSWVEIIGVEYETLISAYPFDDTFRALGGSIRLLDVGCGTAIFPGYLDPVLSEEVHIRTDLLDQSATSLSSAFRVLADLEHFSNGESFRADIENLPEIGESRYDAIWAIHSFTTVDRERMPETFRRLVAALRPGGWLFVYQLTAASSYQRVHSWYRESHGGDRYMEYEDSARILASGGYHYAVYELAFDHVVPDRPEAVTGYLRKVTLDEAVTADQFEPILSEYRSGDVLRFPQSVNLIAVPQQARP